MGIRQYLMKSAISRRRIPPEVVAEVEKDLLKNGPRRLEPEKRHFQFVMVSLEEAVPEVLPALIQDVVRTLLAHDAMLFPSTSSILVAILGIPDPSNDSAETRVNLVRATLAKHGSNVRIAHGECTGLVGNLGEPGFSRFDAIIPNSAAILRKLLDIEFGTAIEIAQ
jgi:hypothetical protein